MTTCGAAERQVAALHVAGADVGGEAAYYLALYSYYLGGAVAPRGFFYSQVGYAVGLCDHAMRHAAGEHIADRGLVRMETIGVDFRRANHALAQIVDELQRVLGVALGGAVADDRASRSGEVNVGVLVAGNYCVR